MIRRTPRSPLFPYTALFRSLAIVVSGEALDPRYATASRLALFRTMTGLTPPLSAPAGTPSCLEVQQGMPPPVVQGYASDRRPAPGLAGRRVPGRRDRTPAGADHTRGGRAVDPRPHCVPRPVTPRRGRSRNGVVRGRVPEALHPAPRGNVVPRRRPAGPQPE